MTGAKFHFIYTQTVSITNNSKTMGVKDKMFDKTTDVMFIWMNSFCNHTFNDVYIAVE